MAKKGRKLTKEELEQDPLLTFYQRVQQFHSRYKTYIYGGLVAAVLILIASVTYYYHYQSQEKKAQQLLGFAEQHFRNGEYQKALTGEGAEYTIGLRSIMQRYSGTKSANLSHYYAAIAEYKLGNTQQALQYIEDYSPPEGILGVGPIAFHGMLFNEIGEHARAAKKYEKAASWSDNESTTPYNLYKAANAHFEAGNYTSARRIADRVISDYEQSSHAEKAKKLKGRLLTVSSSS